MEDTGNVLKTVEDIISMTTPQATANDDDMIISQKSLFTSRWTPDQIRKRKLFRYSTLQVTPKKSKDSIGIQRSPTKQKHT
ncbi:hypothetical protein CHS0354_015077 [Potamilus streckersoni]|uniref:Uncharacterized protein n=1 Tax=Potamilus streckersoni TaxID=2493646 RepID=A0AAE0WD60_9BIVA|nr:hypothetical protein CHS0354_015077 [Potamilus streckersoni]